MGIKVIGSNVLSYIQKIFNKLGIRLTGVNIFSAGVTWEHTKLEEKGVQELFFFLETKSILVNPIERVVKQECIESALEIKQKLTELCFQQKFSNYVIDRMRLMADACNDFLDNVDSVKTVEADGDREDSTFLSAMKQFRKVFRNNINLLSSAYKLTFNKIIPENY